jgi:hypothetical protein
MTKKPFGFLLAAALILGSTAGAPKDRVNVNYLLVEEGDIVTPTDDKPSISVYTTESKFNDFYRYLHMDKVPVQDPPAIDFSQDYVLFIDYGQQTTAGYHIQVHEVYQRKDGSLVVKAFLVGPPNKFVTAEVVTYPYLLMTVPRSNYVRVELVNENDQVIAWTNV